MHRSRALFAALVVAHAAAASPSPASGSAVWKEASQHVFFAVLEGLYEDGVGSDAVALVIGEEGMPERERFDRTFVYACPLCHPAYEAFKLYGRRTAFFGMKQPTDTLGPGLPPSVMERLASGNDAVRRDAIQELIERWVERRVERLRLDDAELADLTRAMEAARDQGMRMLEASRASAGEPAAEGPRAAGSAKWRSCAICDGGVKGCRRVRTP